MEWHLLWLTLIVVIYNIWHYYHEDDNYKYSLVASDTSDLKMMLDSFFRTARTLDLEIEKCRLQECER